jgi:glycosyltransferase involved in cell wall biosynthesis
MSKRICIISFSPIARDARVLRQIKYLGPRYDLTVIGFGDAHPSWDDSPTIQWRPLIRQPSSWGVRLSELALLTVAGYARPASYEHWYWRRPHHRAALEHASATPCDAYHANDWEALPVAVEAARAHGAKVVFDAHEYSPLEFEDRRTWRLLYARPISYFLRKYAPTLSASTTVAPAIAEKYCQEFGLNPAVVLNCPEKMDHQPRPVDPGCIRLIHHGMAQRGRRLDIMIEAIALADPRYHLHLMLLGDPSYIGQLQAQAGRVAPDRITFHPPVSPAEIGGCIVEFDMGVFILPPVNFNWTVALPNKLFDYINAGLATCIGPSPEMARLVREYRCGVVAPSFDPADVAAALNALRPEDIHVMKQGSVGAREVLNAQVEMGKVVDLYSKLLGEAN